MSRFGAVNEYRAEEQESFNSLYIMQAAGTATAGDFQTYAKERGLKLPEEQVESPPEEESAQVVAS